jgi:hypothetical protein
MAPSPDVWRNSVLWDLSAARRVLVVNGEARTLGLRLQFIAAGMTGEVQTLDRRIMGSLKQRVAVSRRRGPWGVRPLSRTRCDLLLDK